MGQSDMFRHCRAFRWLWLVFLSAAMVTGAERHHHHYKHQHQDTRHSAQPELQLLPLPSECPNCIQHSRTQNSDEIRLETIKRQILSKLGLKEKPNVTAPVPRDVIMETLYRAEETGDQHDGSGSDAKTVEEAMAGPVSTRAPDSEPDDFYGRTSEIIAFAEPGHTLNGQSLLEFAHPYDLGGGAGTELRVKAATLWVTVDFRSPLHRAFRHNVPDKNLTLWIFTVTQNLQTNTTHLSGI